MAWRRRRSASWIRDNADLITTLATYNSEVARGIVHTEEWKALMAEAQAWFNQMSLEDPPQ